ncbi:hypothetical protein [Pseudomonas sp. 7SR1]
MSTCNAKATHRGRYAPQRR